MTPNDLMKIANEQGAVAAYGALCGVTWAQSLKANVPSHMHHVVLDWVANGRTYDDFFSSIVNNDLMEAIKNADDVNRHMLVQYGTFLYNGAPSECFGSKEKVMAWSAQGGMLKRGEADGDD